MGDLPDIVLVVADTLRRDSVGAYGGESPTPNLDLLGKEGTVYPNCVAPSPWTLPSHASLFTGSYPSQHGVHETWDIKPPKLFGSMAKSGRETLAEYLRRRGYNTVGYSGNPSVAPGSGFDSGFNAFTLFDSARPDEWTRGVLSSAASLGTDRGEILRNALKKGKLGELYHLFRLEKEIQKRERKRRYPLFKGGDRIAATIAETSFERPFFLFVNLFEMHEPYTVGETGIEPSAVMDLFGKHVIGPELLSKMKRVYHEEASLVDGFVGMIIRKLKDARTYSESMVVVTSDHGQAFKERGYYGHGTFLYDEITRVPLIVKPPGGRKVRTAEGYQNLVGVQGLIKDELLSPSPDDHLTEPVSISESFGIAHNIEAVRGTPSFEDKRREFDRPRKAVYSGGWKMVVNGADGSVEELLENGIRVNPSEKRAEVRVLAGAIGPLAGSGFRLPV